MMPTPPLGRGERWLSLGKQIYRATKKVLELFHQILLRHFLFLFPSAPFPFHSFFVCSSFTSLLSVWCTFVEEMNTAVFQISVSVPFFYLLDNTSGRIRRDLPRKTRPYSFLHSQPINSYQIPLY